jgi:hypothetical protein
VLLVIDKLSPAIVPCAQSLPCTMPSSTSNRSRTYDIEFRFNGPGSLGPSTFAPVQIDIPEGGQGVCYTVQFVFKSRAFLLELADYRLHQCS